MGGGAAGDDEDAAIDGVGGRDLEVVTLEVEAADDVPKGREGEMRDCTTHSLVRADAADG